MKKVMLSAFLLLGVSAARVSSAPVVSAKDSRPSQTNSIAGSKAVNSQQSQWIGKSLREMQTIKVGMTRAQLAKVFTTEGGVSSRTWRRYVYRQCPYIKVNVEFKPVSKSKKYPHSESRNDVITKISQPFLEWSIAD